MTDTAENTDMTDQNNPDTEQRDGRLLIEQNKIESVVTKLLGYEVDEEGYIIGDDGERIDSTDGEPIPIDEIGYLGSGPNGELEPVPANFSEKVRYLSDRDFQ